LFPGDLPERPDSLFENGQPVALNFLRFTPPQKLETNTDGEVVLPHIRFDRALDYLIGDWMA
jgi:predicted YcjX-like family ATPase